MVESHFTTEIIDVWPFCIKGYFLANENLLKCFSKSSELFMVLVIDEQMPAQNQMQGPT